MWLDSNGNGLQDRDEEGFPNVTVNRYIRPVAGDEFERHHSTTTNIDGFYLFSELIAESDFLEFVPPEGWAFTLMGRGQTDETDGDADVQSGRTRVFSFFDHDSTWAAGLIEVGGSVSPPVPTATQTPVPESAATETRRPSPGPTVTTEETPTLESDSFDDGLTISHDPCSQNGCNLWPPGLSMHGWKGRIQSATKPDRLRYPKPWKVFPDG